MFCRNAAEIVAVVFDSYRQLFISEANIEIRIRCYVDAANM